MDEPESPFYEPDELGPPFERSPGQPPIEILLERTKGYPRDTQGCLWVPLWASPRYTHRIPKGEPKRAPSVVPWIPPVGVEAPGEPILHHIPYVQSHGRNAE